MFGLSIKEKLTKKILEASKKHISSYKETVLDTIKANYDEERQKIYFFGARNAYLDDVANDVINSIGQKNPIIGGSIISMLSNPSKCGYDEIDISRGLMAGSLFAICYYAFTDKVASPRDCIELNHLQNDIMDEALKEIATDMAYESLKNP